MTTVLEKPMKSVVSSAYKDNQFITIAEAERLTGYSVEEILHLAERREVVLSSGTQNEPRILLGSLQYYALTQRRTVRDTYASLREQRLLEFAQSFSIPDQAHIDTSNILFPMLVALTVTVCILLLFLLVSVFISYDLNAALLYAGMNEIVDLLTL